MSLPLPKPIQIEEEILVRDIHLAAWGGLSTIPVLTAEGAGVFENVGRDGLDEFEHLIGELSYFPLRLAATAQFEEMQESPSVHGHDERRCDSLREQVPCIFMFKTCVELLFVTTDIAIDSETNKSARSDVITDDVTPLGLDGERRNAMSCKLRETNAAYAVDSEREIDMLEHREMSRLDHSFNDALGAVGIDIKSSFIRSASPRGETNQCFGLGRVSEQRYITIRLRQ